MDLLVAKTLSALLLWILSLCFGLLVPFLIWKWKSTDDCRVSVRQNHGLETENLISDSAAYPTYNSIDNSSQLLLVKNYCGRCRRWISKYDITSFINCCCGGLFLGICLLELLPESKESIEQVLHALNISTTFPVTEFIIAVGFLFVMIIEQLVTSACVNKNYSSSDSSDDQNSSEQRRIIESRSEEQSSLSVDVCPNENEDHIIVEQSRNAEATRSIILVVMLSIHSTFEGLALGLEVSISNLIQLLIAISVHKCVIAFSLGIKLFESFRSSRILVAVICIFIFCTGSPLGCGIGIIMSAVSADEPNTGPGTNVTYVPTTFSPNFTQPYNNVSGTLIANAILECLATGTFLYVTFVEVIPTEFFHTDHDHSFNESQSETRSRNHNRKVPINPAVKLSALIFGFLAISALQFL